MGIRDAFIERLRNFLAAHRVRRGEFGRLAVSDRDFIRDVENGRATIQRIERAEDFMARVAADPAVLDRLRNGNGASQAESETLGVGGNP